MHSYCTPNGDPIPYTPGIYLITCLANKRIYIGSATDLYTRWANHLSQLRRNIHNNRHLQRAWQKYGEDAFTFDILELVLVPELLTAREQYWFAKLRPFGKRGFNMVPTAGSTLGRVVSQETREKLRIANTGKPGVWTGKKRDQATREKIAAARRGKPAHNRGKKASPESRAKMSASAKRKPPVSLETREKQSRMRRGKPKSAETRARMSAANLGKKFSEETCRKISEAKKGKKRN